MRPLLLASAFVLALPAAAQEMDPAQSTPAPAMPAQSSPFSDAERTALHAEIRAYLLAHPELLMEIMQILEAQRRHIEAELERREQLVLDFDDVAMCQREAERKGQQARLASIPRELALEPERIRRVYEVKATRTEPVGLVYLWPVTG